MNSGYFSLLSFHAHRSQAQVCETSEVRPSALRCGTNDDLGQYLCNLRALEGFHVGWRDASPSHSESHVLVRFSSSSVSTAVIQVGKWKGPLLDEYFALSHTRSISRARLFLDPIGTFQGNCLRCRCRTAGPAKFGERSLPEAYWSRIGRIYGKLRISDASGIPTASRFRKNGGGADQVSCGPAHERT